MSAALVKELRERTGLGLLECKRALASCGGDVEAAIEELRKSSGMKAAKKAGRTAADGVVAARVADDGSYAVVAEIHSPERCRGADGRRSGVGARGTGAENW